MGKALTDGPVAAGIWSTIVRV